MDGFKQLTKDKQQKVLATLDKQEQTTQSVDNALMQKNKFTQEEWNKKSYHEHKLDLMDSYYAKWEQNDKQDYKTKIDEINNVQIESSLQGEFKKNEQPGKRFFYKSRKSEDKKIKEYQGKVIDGAQYLHFGKNTVREMAALDKYKNYHTKYFETRNNQRDYYSKYTNEHKKPVVQDWDKIYEKQMKAHGMVWGALKGTWKGLSQRGKDLLYKIKPGEKIDGTQELDEGIRPFFSMTKKVLFWKKQVGLLGTETEEERKDGSEYNKRILRMYTENKPGDRVKVMDELASKLIRFKLTPNMFTNKYLASNMLQMQRYTDMLNAFVYLTQCNPDYLDTTKKNSTDPEFASLIWSRIILMAPIMKHFMEQHALYCGYKKDKKVTGSASARTFLNDKEKEGAFDTEEKYDAFVKDTWTNIQQVYESASDFLDESADKRMQSTLTEIESRAVEFRNSQKAKAGNKTAGQKQDKKEEQKKDDDEIIFKYDIKGECAQKLQSAKDKIRSNPLSYDVFGLEIGKIYDKLNVQLRRVDELGARKIALDEMVKKESFGSNAHNIAAEDVKKVWNDYIKKETVRINNEKEILDKQIENYMATIDFFTGINVNDKNLQLSLDNAFPGVKNVLKYEGLDHIFHLQEAIEYNDLFYKTIDYYDFDKFTIANDIDGKEVKIKDMQAQYNFTLLKRGLQRANYVNNLVNGTVQKDINDPSKLNNIDRRKTAKENFEKYKEQYADIEVTLDDILKLKPADYEEKFALKKDLDVTNEETYKRYFWMEKVKNILDDLEFRKIGPEGYNGLTRTEKLDLWIKGRLIRDYFHKWKGTMMLTISDAYNYIIDTPNMIGGNDIIDGIDDKYQLQNMLRMKEKFDKQISDMKKENPEITEENDPKFKKLCELQRFMEGMVETKNYAAQEIKVMNDQAYQSYKADMYKDIMKQQLEIIYNQDVDKLKEDKILYEGDRKAYIEQRLDNAVGMVESCDIYLRDRASYLREYAGIEVEGTTRDKNLITQQFEIEKNKKIKQAKAEKNYKDDKNYELSANEKVKLVKGYYGRFKTIVDKIRKTYCKDGKLDDKAIMVDLKSILAEMEFCKNFIEFNHELNDKENNDEANKEEKIFEKVYSSKDLDSLGDQELLVSDFRDYVNLLLMDHGISPWHNYDYKNRHDIKQHIVLTDSAFSTEMEEAEKVNKEFNEEQRRISKEKSEVEAEFDALTKLNAQELELVPKLTYQEMEQRYNEGDKSIEKLDMRPYVAYRVKTKYDDRLKELESQKKKLNSSLSKVSDDTALLRYFRTGIFDSKIKQQEKPDEQGIKTDWITKQKESRKILIEEQAKKMDQPASRNYVDELFSYIYKKAGNVEFLTPDQVKNVLTQASKAFFFTLSKEARAEATLRLRLYEKDKNVMNDYFIWKNNRDTNKTLIERCKIFGQDAFVKENIESIRNIMDAIAETNACINDMQMPRFMDELKENLEIKGINQKQFMFLLRKHTVGLAGRAVTKDDANKAGLNKEDVDQYLKVETRDDFLEKVANDALEVGEKIDLSNVNEEYIKKNFAECYFNANKLLAFQQLYYGEKDAYDKMYDTRGKRGLVKRVRTYFDKGHGESYVLYYNAVMSVANKYGITEKGGLTFGLSPEVLETLMDNTKKDHHNLIRNQVIENRKNAEEQLKVNLDAIKTAYAETKMAQTVDQAVSKTLLGVALEENITVGENEKKVVRDNYGLKEEDIQQDSEKKKGLDKFYKEYTDAYNGAQAIYYGFKEKEHNNDKVTYTVSNSFHPQLMFMLAPGKNFFTSNAKTENTETATNFKKLFKYDTENIAGNLSVIDEEKCKSVINTIQKLGLDKGKIEKAWNEKGESENIYDEAFFDKCMKDEKFYTDMVNAMNFCIIYENEEQSFINIEGYERQLNDVFKAYDKKNPVDTTDNKDKADELKQENIEKQRTLMSLWNEVDGYGKVLDVYNNEISKLNRELDDLRDEQDKCTKKLLMLRSTAKSMQENALKIEDLIDQSSKLEKKINAKNKELTDAKMGLEDTGKQYDKAREELTKDGRAKAANYHTDLLTREKLQTLKQVKEMFSDKKTRFMVSTYFDLFNAYLLKKGIKIDGSLVNAQIFDEALRNKASTVGGKETMTRNDAIDLGTDASAHARKNNATLFDAKQKLIKGKNYLDEYDSLEDKQKVIDKDTDPAEIKKKLDKIIADRNSKANKSLEDVDYVLKMKNQDKLDIRKHAKTTKDVTVKNLQKYIVLIDAYDKTKKIKNSKDLYAVWRGMTEEELKIIKGYKGELDQKLEKGEMPDTKYRFFDSANFFDMLQSNIDVKTKNTAELLAEYQKKKKEQEQAAKEAEEKNNLGFIDGSINNTSFSSDGDNT